MKQDTECSVTLSLREWIDISHMLLKSTMELRDQIENSSDEKYHNYILTLGEEMSKTLDRIVTAVEEKMK